MLFNLSATLPFQTDRKCTEIKSKLMGVIQRQGIKNVILNYFGLFIGFVNVLIIQPNYLTKDEVGLLKIMFAFSSLMATFLPMGMNSITTKFFPQFRNPETRHYGYFGLMLIFPLIGFLLISALLLIFKSYVFQYYEHSKLFTHYFYLLFPFIFILGFLSVIHSYAFSLLKTTVPSFINEFIIRLTLIGLTMAYYFKLFNLDSFIYLYVVVYGLQVILVILYVIWEEKPSLKFDLKYLNTQNPRAMMKYGFLLSFAALTSMALKSLDAIMLGHYVSLAVVGVFAIAVMIPTIIEAPLNALDKIAAPRISNAWLTNNMVEIQDIYYKSTKYLLLLGGLLFLGININIQYLYQLTAKDYASGVNVVLIISVGTLINMATGLNDSILSYSHKYIYLTYMLVLLFVLAIVNNIIFIPIWGMEGAAFATCLSSFIYNTIKYFYIWKTFKLQPFDKNTLLTLLLIGACFGLNYLLPVLHGAIFNILFRSIIVTGVYGLGTYFLNIIPEYHHLIPFIGKKKG